MAGGTATVLPGAGVPVGGSGATTVGLAGKGTVTLAAGVAGLEALSVGVG